MLRSCCSGVYCSRLKRLREGAWAGWSTYSETYCRAICRSADLASLMGAARENEVKSFLVMKANIATWEYEGGGLAAGGEAAKDELDERRRISVTVHDRSGRPSACVSSASSFRTAIQSAAKWFATSDLRAPKPNRDTVYELTVAGDCRKWHVCGGTVQRVK